MKEDIKKLFAGEGDWLLRKAVGVDTEGNTEWEERRFPRKKDAVSAATRYVAKNISGLKSREIQLYFVGDYDTLEKKCDIGLLKKKAENAEIQKLRAVAHLDEWPRGVRTAEDLVENCDLPGITADRLNALADMRLCPHYRIENGTPLFQLNTVKRWLAEQCMEYIEGKNGPLEIVAPVQLPVEPIWDIPTELQWLAGRIIDFSPVCISGIYFLCSMGKLVYVGKSVNVCRRIGDHLGAIEGGVHGTIARESATGNKNWDAVYVLPIPECYLDSVETALIRVLSPPLNNSLGLSLANIEEEPESILEKYGFRRSSAQRLD